MAFRVPPTPSRCVAGGPRSAVRDSSVRHVRLVARTRRGRRRGWCRRQRGYQRALVQVEPRRDVDQHAARPERLQDRASTRWWVSGRRRVRRHQRVHLRGHRVGGRRSAVADVWPGPPIAIDDRDQQASSRRAMAMPIRPRPRMPACRSRRVTLRQWKAVPRRPFPGAEVALRRRQLAHRHDEEADRDVGDFLGQDIRRVGHDHAASGRGAGVDRDRSRPRNLPRSRAGGARPASVRRSHSKAGGDPGDPVAVPCDQAGDLGVVGGAMRRERCGEPLERLRWQTAHDQHLDVCQVPRHHVRFPGGPRSRASGGGGGARPGWWRRRSRRR